MESERQKGKKGVFLSTAMTLGYEGRNNYTAMYVKTDAIRCDCCCTMRGQADIAERKSVECCKKGRHRGGQTESKKTREKKTVKQRQSETPVAAILLQKSTQIADTFSSWVGPYDF